MERTFNRWEWQAIFGETLPHYQTGGVDKRIKSPDCQTFLFFKKRKTMCIWQIIEPILDYFRINTLIIFKRQISHTHKAAFYHNHKIALTIQKFLLVKNLIWQTEQYFSLNIWTKQKSVKSLVTKVTKALSNINEWFREHFASLAHKIKNKKLKEEKN